MTGYASDLHYDKFQHILAFYSKHQTTGWGGFAGSQWSAVVSDVREKARELSSTDLIRKLHAESGLTWDQIARLFGVSRRSVHMWANGGTPKAENLELLMKATALVEELSGSDPKSKRIQLLTSKDGQPSLFEELKVSRGRGIKPINGPVFTPGELLGYSRD